jgi:LacI family transcriptional regulator
VNPPTALITTNYALTLAALEALHWVNRRCPQDLSLVAFDDPAWAALTEPPLTAIRHPLDGLADGCVDLLLALLLVASDEDAAPAQDIVLPTTLVERASCRRVVETRDWSGTRKI